MLANSTSRVMHDRNEAEIKESPSHFHETTKHIFVYSVADHQEASRSSRLLPPLISSCFLSYTSVAFVYLACHTGKSPELLPHHTILHSACFVLPPLRPLVHRRHRFS